MTRSHDERVRDDLVGKRVALARPRASAYVRSSPSLRPLVAQIATLSAAVAHAVDAHPDGNIVTSLFRKGCVCAASLLAEIGDDRARFVSGDHLLPKAAPRL